jgi:5-formyltetrahydrofolate cyclo-ligase
MNSADLKRAKRRIRGEVLAARDALDPSERERASASIAGRVLDLPELERAVAAMAFWSFGSEVNTASLIAGLHARDVLVALPRIVEGDLEPVRFAPGDPVTTTAFGAREPSSGRTLDPSAIDVVITPGVAFDLAGHRVGYGGGFYDRFFLRTSSGALRIGIGFEAQVVPGDLPAGRFDLELDILVTESRVVRFAGPG